MGPGAVCAGDCPDLPVWSLGPDGLGDFDLLIELGPADLQVLSACRAKLRACQACLQRGRDAGVIR